MQAAERGIHRVIVNLTKVGYMGCAGLGALIGSLKRLRKADGNLVLVRMGLRVQRLFEFTGATKISDIYLTKEKPPTQKMSEGRVVEEYVYV